MALVVTIPAQASLFASTGEIAIDRTFSRALRTPLDARSWVERVPGWLSGRGMAREILERGTYERMLRAALPAASVNDLFL